MARRQQERQAQAQRTERELEAGHASPAGGIDLVGRLHQLADLKAMGALTEKEFTAAKNKLLNE